MLGKHLCKRCKNFIVGGSLENGCTCKAFPNGIPYEVYSSVNMWRPPKDCNNGIGFEKKRKRTSNRIIINDEAPVTTEKDWRECAAELGIEYEDYMVMLDRGIYEREDVDKFIKELQGKRSE